MRSIGFLLIGFVLFITICFGVPAYQSGQLHIPGWFWGGLFLVGVALLLLARYLNSEVPAIGVDFEEKDALPGRLTQISPTLARVDTPKGSFLVFGYSSNDLYLQKIDPQSGEYLGPALHGNKRDMVDGIRRRTR